MEAAISCGINLFRLSSFWRFFLVSADAVIGDLGNSSHDKFHSTMMQRWRIKLWNITTLVSVQVVGFFDVAARLCAGDGPITAGPILSVFPALIVHSELKSVRPGFPVAFIF